MPVAEQLTDRDAVHAEGPVWFPQWGGLRWVDVLAGDVLHLDESTGRVDRWRIGQVAATIRPRERRGHDCYRTRLRRRRYGRRRCPERLDGDHCARCAVQRRRL